MTVKLQAARRRMESVRLTASALDLRMREAGRHLEVAHARSDAAMRGLLRDRKARQERAAGRVSIEPLTQRIRTLRDRLDMLERRKDQSISVRLERVANRLTQADRLLNTLSHQAILARGFVLVLDENGALVRRAAELGDGVQVSMQFADGAKEAITAGHTRSARRSAKPVTGGQGSLF